MIQKPKGTYDMYGDMVEKYNYLKRIFNDLMNEYNIKYIDTPIFESSSLYHRENTFHKTFAKSFFHY